MSESKAPTPEQWEEILREIRMAHRDLAPMAGGVIIPEAAAKARERLHRIILERGDAYFYT